MSPILLLAYHFLKAYLTAHEQVDTGFQFICTRYVEKPTVYLLKLAIRVLSGTGTSKQIKT